MEKEIYGYSFSRDSNAEVFCLDRPSVRPESITSRRVMSATVPPMSAKRPRAVVISLIARNILLYSLYAGQK